MAEPYWSDDQIALYLGKCEDVLPGLAPESVDAIVTDPPAAVSFMGREWDSDRGGRARWVEWLAGCMESATRCLKPGGHALVWSLPRTAHWTAWALEDAGLEIRDCIPHLFGSGFPKNLDVGKAIDKRGGRPDLAAEIGAAIRQARVQRGWTTGQADRHFCGGTTNWTWFEGRKGICRPPSPDDFAQITAEWPELAQWAELVAEAERDVIAARRGVTKTFNVGAVEVVGERPPVTAPATEGATRWEGWGTALKPGQEIWWIAQKPPGQDDTLDEIGSHLDRLAAECRQLASDAAQSSAPTQADSPGAMIASAPAYAATPPEACRESATPTGKAAGSSVPTDTSPSRWTAGTFLSTVTSWRQCWAELCEAMSTSTTGTTSSTTIDLKTLSSCLSRITAGNILASQSLGYGPPSLVSAADSLFAAAVLNSRATLTLSATGNASSGTPPESPAEGALSHSSGQELWWLARKPFKGSVAGNVLEHGTGALNVAGCRVPTSAEDAKAMERANTPGSGRMKSGGSPIGTFVRSSATGAMDTSAGRWPPNLLLTHSAACGTACADDCPVAELDRQSGYTEGGNRPSRRGGIGYGSGACGTNDGVAITYDAGGASRFYPAFRYQAKAPAYERPRLADGTAHSTVKPVSLMQWLVRLITPPGGVVLDLFAGTGTTAEACIVEGFRCVLIEQDPVSAELIRTRLRKDIQPSLFGAAS